jgi:hypothetical protein
MRVANCTDALRNSQLPETTRGNTTGGHTPLFVLWQPERVELSWAGTPDAPPGT